MRKIYGLMALACIFHAGQLSAQEDGAGMADQAREDWQEIKQTAKDAADKARELGERALQRADEASREAREAHERAEQERRENEEKQSKPQKRFYY